MADTSRMNFVVAPTDGPGSGAHETPDGWPVDIIAKRSFVREQARYLILFSLCVAVVLSAWAGSALGGSGDDARRIDVARRVLSGPTIIEPALLTDGAFALAGLWSLHPTLESLTLQPLAPQGVDLDVRVIGGETAVVARDGQPLVNLGSLTLDALVTDEIDGVLGVDLVRSLLLAHGDPTEGAGNTPALQSRFDDPIDAGAAYVAALLAADPTRLVGAVGPDPDGAVMRHPDAFATLVGARGGFVVTDVGLIPIGGAPPGQQYLSVERLSARGLTPGPTELRIERGCAVMNDPTSADAPVTDCQLMGTATLGRPVPTVVVAVQGVHGWRIDHPATETRAWASMLQRNDVRGAHHLGLELVEWGLVSPDSVPVDGTLLPGPDPAPVDAPAPRSPIPPASTPDSPALPSAPLGSLAVPSLSGDFDAARMVAAGFVGAPEDLTDFGFTRAQSIAWDEAGEGAMAMVVTYASDDDAAREFAVFHGDALVDGDANLAIYGPGEFVGPTDRGRGITQVRYVLRSGSHHLLIETWGDPASVTSRAEALLGS